MGIPWLQEEEEEIKWLEGGGEGGVEGGWQRRGRDGDEAARGGGMVSARWVQSRLVEKCLQ